VGFRARKTIKIVPGVRMTVSPRGVSTSVGIKGARVSVNSKGRVTKSVGIPGSGVSYVTSSSLNPKRSAPAAKTPAGGSTPARTATPTHATPAAPPTPGMLAPRWEKALHTAAVKNRDASAVRRVATEYPEAQRAASIYETLLLGLPATDPALGVSLLGFAWSVGIDPLTDPFISKYTPGLTLTLDVAEGITVTLPLDRDTIGLALAEAYQATEDLPAAVDIVEQLTPTTVAAVSLAELYLELERWNDVVDLTNGLTNVDDAAMQLLTQRAYALRESGQPGAALEALKEALRLRTRPATLRHRALIVRAMTYLDTNKVAMARKDLDKVLAEDASYPGLREALAALPAA